MQYSLIGKSLPHSYSIKIHEGFNNHEYSLLELDSIDKVIEYINNKQYYGLNVTIPYKEVAFRNVDILDDIAKATNVINTIVNYKGTLIGYNTDYYGFIAMLSKNHIKVKDKNCLILGSGATCKTVSFALSNLKAKDIKVVSRSKGLTYDKLDSIASSIDIIINTTPFNMYPNITNVSLIDINMFTNLKAVIDVIYNPINSKLLIDAKKKGIKAINGLYMLVYQAYVSELLFNNKVDRKQVDRVYERILLDNSNIVLIGMPSSGKSYIGKEIANITNKKFIDTDKLIEERINGPIANYIKQNGEDSFRKIEEEVIDSIKDHKGYVIATGGGVILKESNIINLSRNGIFIYLKRKLKDLLVSNDRPLTDSKEKLKEVFIFRRKIYNNIASFVIKDKNAKKAAKKIIKLVRSYYG